MLPSTARCWTNSIDASIPFIEARENKLEPVMSVLKIHLTYTCTAQCDHCRFRCMREPGPVIDGGLVMDCVRELQRLNHLDLVVLMGGEPGLVSSLTHSLAAQISALGIGVRVETNASWATNDEAARRFLKPLFAVKTQVMYSLDAWHEPYVDPERVFRAARISEELGGDFVIEAPYLDFKHRDNAYDQRTDSLLAEMERRLGKPALIYRGPILFNGRAADRLAYLAPECGIPSEICDQVPWWSNGHLRTLELLELDPDGYLSKGCGIAIASLHETPVAEILAQYDAEAHPIFSTLLTSGPLGLALEARDHGYELKDCYADKCQLCQEAREYLLDEYPRYLAPAQHYRKKA
jgi:organic radical activating enzyme